MISNHSRSAILKKYYSSYTGLSASAWQGIFISFIEATLMGVCYFLAIYFVTELHLSIADAGMIMAFYGVGTIFGGMLGGKLSDLIPPRIVSIGSLVLQAVAYFLLIKLKSTPLLMLNLFIIGIGSYGFITSNHVWTLSRCKQEERLKAINILDVVSNLGLALSGLIISLISTKNFNSLFFMAGCLISLTAVSLLISNKNQFTNTIRQDDKTISSKPSDHKIIYFVLVCLFLVGFIISQTNSTYPIYLQSIFPAMGTRSFGILFTLNAILVVVFQGPFVNQLGKFNKILLIGSGAFFIGFWNVSLKCRPRILDCYSFLLYNNCWRNIIFFYCAINLL